MLVLPEARQTGLSELPHYNNRQAQQSQAFTLWPDPKCSEAQILYARLISDSIPGSSLSLPLAPSILPTTCLEIHISEASA